MLRHYLQWHIIHSCNLQCVHCYQDDVKAVMPFEMMLQVLDRYVEYLKFYNFEGQINLTGGEPLLHPDFFRLAAEIRKRNIRLGVLTNGTLIDDEAARRLAALSPVFVQVSLDGPKDIHDTIRGKGQFERALLGIDCLKKKKVKVLVSFTAMKQNVSSFSELAAVCKKHKVDKLWWDRVVTDDEKLYLSTLEFKALSEEAVRLSKKYKFISNTRALQGLPDNTCGYTCSAGKQLLILLANGDMMPCRRLPFVIGKIDLERSLSEQLEVSEIMQELAKPTFPIGCVRCSHFAKCRGGAKCVTYAQTGELGERDVNCWLPM